MRTLHNAYVFVSQGQALNKTTSLKDLQGDFDSFCNAQELEPPPFVDIHADIHKMVALFNSKFEATHGNHDCHLTRYPDNTWPAHFSGAFAPGGYDATPSVDPGHTYVPHIPRTVDTPMISYDRRIVKYTEPMGHTRSNWTQFDNHDPVADFSVFVGKLHVSDYREGLAPPEEHDHSIDVADVTDVMAEFCRRTDELERFKNDFDPGMAGTLC
jgi:hypothetical protein